MRRDPHDLRIIAILYTFAAIAAVLLGFKAATLGVDVTTGVCWMIIAAGTALWAGVEAFVHYRAWWRRA